MINELFLPSRSFNQLRKHTIKHTVAMVQQLLQGVLWSRGNVLASRSKVRGFKPTEVDGFFQDVKILNIKSFGRDFKLGSRVCDFRLVKESQA